MVDLGDVGEVAAMNDRGQIVGTRYPTEGGQLAFSWTAAGGTTVLGTFFDGGPRLVITDGGRLKSLRRSRRVLDPTRRSKTITYDSACKMRGADLACHRWRYDFRMADDTPDEIPWCGPGHHRVGIPGFPVNASPARSRGGCGIPTAGCSRANS